MTVVFSFCFAYRGVKRGGFSHIGPVLLGIRSFSILGSCVLNGVASGMGSCKTMSIMLKSLLKGIYAEVEP